MTGPQYPLAMGDRSHAIQLVIHQLQPVGRHLITRNAAANLRAEAALAPAFALPFLLAAEVIEAVCDERHTPEQQHEATQTLRARLMGQEPDALELVDGALLVAIAAALRRIAADAATVRLESPWWVGLLVLLVALVLGCASARGVRAGCREQCADLRGPSWSLWGGPTLPSDRFLECVDQCCAAAGSSSAAGGIASGGP